MTTAGMGYATGKQKPPAFLEGIYNMVAGSVKQKPPAFVEQLVATGGNGNEPGLLGQQSSGSSGKVKPPAYKAAGGGTWPGGDSGQTGNNGGGQEAKLPMFDKRAPGGAGNDETEGNPVTLQAGGNGGAEQPPKPNGEPSSIDGSVGYILLAAAVVVFLLNRFKK